MSCFKWCSGYIHPRTGRKTAHLMSCTDPHGSPCPGSYEFHTPMNIEHRGVQQVHSGFVYCRGSLIEPMPWEQDALHAAWKLGGHEATAQLMETFSGFDIQRPSAGWGAVDRLRASEGL